LYEQPKDWDRLDWIFSVIAFIAATAASTPPEIRSIGRLSRVYESTNRVFLYEDQYLHGSVTSISFNREWCE
jgi:hypothetical protein